MKKVFLGTLVASLLSVMAVPALAAEYDFRKVDCNAVDIRRSLIEAYDEILKDADLGVTVLDTYDQKVEVQTKDRLECVGTYEFSDGDVLRVRYTASLNSMGDMINQFEPIE